MADRKPAPVVPLKGRATVEMDPALATVVDSDMPSGPFAVARIFVGERYTVAGERSLTYWKGEIYTYRLGAWSVLSKDDARAELYEWLFATGRKATKRAVDDVLDAVRAVAKLPDTREAPCWLDRAGLEPGRVIAFRNGLLDLQTRELLPATANFFNLNALEFDYRPDAPIPARWLALLETILPQDPVAIDSLAEIFGYVLSRDTRQQKAFLIIGPPRSGKGTIARVLRHLVGIANVAAPMLANLGAHFGLQELIGKLLAIISDARLSGRADVHAIVENMLRVSGEDPMTVARKFLPDFNGHLPVRFLVLSNEVPTLADASGALPSRFVILRLTQSFLGREDPQLLERLLPELPGILLWSLAGLDRLRARGHFLQPDSGDDVAHDMRWLASPLRQFVDDVCHLDSDADTDASITVHRLFEAWRVWSREEGRESTWTKEMFGSRLRSAVPHVHIRRGPRDALGKRSREYVGFRLREPSDPDPDAPKDGNQ